MKNKKWALPIAITFLMLLTFMVNPVSGYTNAQAETYTVTYDGNGNTGGTVPSPGVPNLIGVVTVAGQNNLVKTGCVFIEWNSERDGSGRSYTEGDLLSVILHPNSTLYAQWKNVYTITYDANGGSGIIPTDTKKYTENQTFKTNTKGALVKANCVFNDWNTQPNGDGTSYKANKSYSMPASSITLYAQWKTQYTVTYDANGGTGTPPSDTNKYFTNDTVTVNDLDITNVAKDGYGFYGWNTQPDGNGTQYLYPSTASKTIAMDTSNVTLYAQWKKVERFEAEAQTIGGAVVEKNIAGASGSQQVGSIDEKGRYVEFKNLPVCKKVFIRYASQNTGKISIYTNNKYKQSLSFSSTGAWNGEGYYKTISINIDINAGDSLKVQFDNGCKPLNLDYLEVEAPLVTFNSNGGSDVIGQYAVNRTAQIPNPSPTKVGCTFVNWCTDATLNTVFDFKSPITKNTTLYAKWAPKSELIITALAVNGSASANHPSYTYNDTAILTSKANSGYRLDGWYDKDNKKVGSELTLNVTVTEAATYTAKFVQITKDLTINMGGTGTGSVTATVNGNVTTLTSGHANPYALGTTVTLTATASADSEFKGWKDSNDKPFSDKPQLQITIADTQTLKAVFNKIIPHHVTFYDNNGNTYKDYEVGPNTTVEQPEGPYYYGHTFANWDLPTTDASTGNISYKPIYEGDSVTITVTNGSGGTTCPIETDVTVSANSESGLKFSHWVDNNDNIVCYDNSFIFKATYNVTFTAIFTETPSSTKTANIAIKNIKLSSGVLDIVSERVVPSGLTLKSHGILLTDAKDIGTADIGTEASYFNINTSGITKKVGGNTAAVGTFVLSKKVSKGTWYVRGYVTYIDEDNNEITVYSKIETKTVN